MFVLYNLLLTLLSPFWVPWMLVRARRRKEQPNWKERMGDFDFYATKNSKRIWFHAVSVGEVMAATPILKELRRLLPDFEIVLSVTTSSGHRTALEHSVGLYDHLVYFPIDVPRFQLAAMVRVRPKAVAIMETELWLNFLWAARTMDARTLLVNGRISDKAYALDRKIKPYFWALFRNMDRVLAQTQTDKKRLESLGAKHVEVLGNCKFDQAMEFEHADCEKIRKELKIPEGRQVVVVGSTRGEEEEVLVVEALREIGLQNLTVVHAPRHLERVEALSERIENAFGQVGRVSQGSSANYLILDTYGQLARVYAAADVVVIGGGFANLGGQNLLQPLALGKPVLHGPHMQNFRDIAQASVEAGASRVCENSKELGVQLRALLSDDGGREKMGEAARNLVQMNLGASRRYAEAIAEEALKEPD